MQTASQMTETSTKATYKTAGVDIDAGNQLVERIKPFAKATARTGLMSGLGGFGALFDLKACNFTDPVLVSATDGVGTKLAVAEAVGKHDTIGIDLVAMCVNDLIVQGAEPLFFLDYFATGKLSVDVAADVISGIAKGCEESGCALIGGETAEMPAMYAPGTYDLAGFAVGAVERSAMLPKTNIEVGDVVIGLPSSGLHSNGYSLVRHVVAHAKLDYQTSCPWAAGKTLGEALLTPTKLYVKPLLQLLRSEAGSAVKALAHITGGGLLENIPRVLPEHIGVELDRNSWQMPEVFQWLQKLGNIEQQEMYRTFNSGIGMVLVVEHAKAAAVMAELKTIGEPAHIIGKTTQRGVHGVVVR